MKCICLKYAIWQYLTCVYICESILHNQNNEHIHYPKTHLGPFVTFLPPLPDTHLQALRQQDLFSVALVLHVFSGILCKLESYSFSILRVTIMICISVLPWYVMSVDPSLFLSSVIPWQRCPCCWLLGSLACGWALACFQFRMLQIKFSSVSCFIWTPSFTSHMYSPGNRMNGSYYRCMLWFFRNC